jgi:hypothetical protein
MTLRESLQRQVDAWEQLGHPSLMERFVLRHGKEMQRGILDHGKDEPGQCFRNASLAMLVGKGTYVEGYAWRSPVRLPIHHAWIKRPNGLVLDPTWRDADLQGKASTFEYLGVEFTDDQVEEHQAKTGFYGMLSTHEMIDLDLIFGLDPELREIAARIKPAFGNV